MNLEILITFSIIFFLNLITSALSQLNNAECILHSNEVWVE